MATPNENPDPDQELELLIAALVALYLAANASLVTDFGRFVREAIAASTIDYRRLRRRILRSANTANARLESRTGGMLDRLFKAIQTSGNARARKEFASAAKMLPDQQAAFKALTHAETSAKAIRDELSDRLTDVRANILRSSNDLYRDIVAQAAEAQVSNRLTPQQSTAQALNQFLEKGITGFTTADGRRMPIDSYVDMAVRTASLRAYNFSYESRLSAMGIEYFLVPNDGHPCPLCWPWQHHVLSRAGKDDIADASIEEARKGGLFHPNCKHVLLPFIPGVSVRPKPDMPWNKEQQAKYDATQRLRSLERRVRQQKLARDHAADLTEKQAANKRIRATEAAIRQHVAKHGLVRRRHRETSRVTTG